MKSVWKMNVNSIYDDSFENNQPFTPLAAWNRFIAAQYYKSLKSVKDGNPGSVVPFFIQNSYAFDDKKTVWTLEYEVTETISVWN